jgi:hypothetical protein
LRGLNERLLATIAGAFTLGTKDGSVRAHVNPHLAALFVTSVTHGVLQVVSQQGPLFEQVHGLTPDSFIGYCMQMIGASFLVKNERLGARAASLRPARHTPMSKRRTSHA